MPPARDKRRAMPGTGATVAIVVVGAALLAGLVMLATGMLSADDDATKSANESVERSLTAPPATRSAGPQRDEIAVVVRPTALLSEPGGGRRLARVKPKTEFGSASVLAVVSHRGGWLRVIASELPNGRRGWIAARDTEPGGVPYRIRARLSGRRIEVLQNGRVVRRIRSAVGEQGTPTPTGTFAVTDKVPFTDPGSAYGCCALALSAHQPDTPSEWTGGDRIAIHATPARESIGRPVTLGCMRVPVADARWLMAHIPLGTQVSIRA
jgi:lipoprotein-anchoring transpeptidase ErfK/SrfK